MDTTPEDLAIQANSLSSGYRVHTHGHEAANAYREAARAYSERGGPLDPYRASRCLDAATWCDAQDAVVSE